MCRMFFQMLESGWDAKEKITLAEEERRGALIHAYEKKIRGQKYTISGDEMLRLRFLLEGLGKEVPRLCFTIDELQKLVNSVLPPEPNVDEEQ